MPILQDCTDEFLLSATEAEKLNAARESELMAAYKQFAGRQLHQALIRHKVTLPNELPFYSDLFNPAGEQLIQAKCRVTRKALREALGELFELGSYIPHKAKAILLPEKPRESLVSLSRTAKVDLIYPNGDGIFETLRANA